MSRRRWKCRSAHFGFLGSVLGCLLVFQTHAGEIFPQPESLNPAIAFWHKIYVEVANDQGLLHDDRYLNIIYESMDMGSAVPNDYSANLIKKRQAHWRSVLSRLAEGGSPRGEAEAVVVRGFEEALGRKPSAKDYRDARKRIRFQRGQQDNFRAGLQRALRIEPEIRRVFSEMGLPPDLAYLPHVESSFRTHVRSRHGAAGMWQFMPSTGRIFMTVDDVLDERLIPERATLGAAQLLRSNFAKLGTWPLAITAYNHGSAGMQRAVRKMGTQDIGAIVESYDGRSFGFASRNFYAQFLAARNIAQAHERYFGKLPPLPVEPVQVVKLPVYLDARALTEFLLLDSAELGDMNLALQSAVWEARKWIPAGYELRLPKGAVKGDTERWLASLPDRYKHAGQPEKQFHVVKRGETLGDIAVRYNATISTLVAINNLKNANRIYPGQRLELISTN